MSTNPPRLESIAWLESLRSSSQAAESVEDIWHSVWVVLHYFHSIIEALIASQDPMNLKRCLSAEEYVSPPALYNWTRDDKELADHIIRPSPALHLPSWDSFLMSVLHLNQLVVGEELSKEVDRDGTHRHLNPQISIAGSASTLSLMPPRCPPGGTSVVSRLQALLRNEKLREFLNEKRTISRAQTDPFDYEPCPDCDRILPPPPVCIDAIRRLEGAKRVDRETFELLLAEAEKQNQALKAKFDTRVGALEDKLSRLQFERKEEAKRRQEHRAEINGYRRQLSALQSAMAEGGGASGRVLGREMEAVRTARVSPVLSCVNEESEDVSSHGTPDSTRCLSQQKTPNVLRSPPISINDKDLRTSNKNSPGWLRISRDYENFGTTNYEQLSMDLVEALEISKARLTDYHILSKSLIDRLKVVMESRNDIQDALKSKRFELDKLNKRFKREKQRNVLNEQSLATARELDFGGNSPVSSAVCAVLPVVGVIRRRESRPSTAENQLECEHSNGI